MEMNPNVIEKSIQTLLGSSYGWDAELNELQYRGNPVSFWLTDHEAAAVKQAHIIAGIKSLTTHHGLVRAGNSFEWYRCNCGEQSNLLWTYKSNSSRILGCSLDCALAKAKGQVKLGHLVDE